MKNLLFTLIIITSCLTTRAQSCYGNITDKQAEKIINKADFIFEGKFLEYRTFHNDSTKKNYTEYKIEVEKVLKSNGNLKKGTVKLIMEGANCALLDGEQIFLNDYDAPPFNGIYLCNTSNYPSSGIDLCRFEKYSYSESDNLIELKLQGGIDFIGGIYGLGKKFASKSEVYNYLSQFNGVKIPKDQSVKKKENVVVNAPVNEQDSVSYASHLAAYQTWLTQAERRISATLEKNNQKKGHHPKDKSIETLILSFDNVIETGTSIKYLEFDVIVACFM